MQEGRGVGKVGPSGTGKRLALIHLILNLHPFGQRHDVSNLGPEGTRIALALSELDLDEAGATQQRGKAIELVNLLVIPTLPALENVMQAGSLGAIRAPLPIGDGELLTHHEGAAIAHLGPGKLKAKKQLMLRLELIRLLIDRLHRSAKINQPNETSWVEPGLRVLAWG